MNNIIFKTKHSFYSIFFSLVFFLSSSVISRTYNPQLLTETKLFNQARIQVQLILKMSQLRLQKKIECLSQELDTSQNNCSEFIDDYQYEFKLWQELRIELALYIPLSKALSLLDGAKISQWKKHLIHKDINLEDFSSLSQEIEDISPLSTNSSSESKSELDIAYEKLSKRISTLCSTWLTKQNETSSISKDFCLHQSSFQDYELIHPQSFKAKMFRQWALREYIQRAQISGRSRIDFILKYYPYLLLISGQKDFKEELIHSLKIALQETNTLLTNHLKQDKDFGLDKKLALFEKHPHISSLGEELKKYLESYFAYTPYMDLSFQVDSDEDKKTLNRLQSEYLQSKSLWNFTLTVALPIGLGLYCLSPQGKFGKFFLKKMVSFKLAKETILKRSLPTTCVAGLDFPFQLYYTIDTHKAAKQIQSLILADGGNLSMITTLSQLRSEELNLIFMTIGSAVTGAALLKGVRDYIRYRKVF